jgi:hypothetical protein
VEKKKKNLTVRYNMRNVYLFRISTSDQGTEGILSTDGFFCRTIELPWRDNKSNISCIPYGDYIVKIRNSNKFGKIYWVTNVPNRSWIYIHPGNVAGDVSKGYKSHVYGCILLGLKHGYLWDQKAVLNSKIAVRKFMNFMNNEDFKLKVIGE